MANLRKHIKNISVHGVTPVIAITAFPGDFDSEHDAIRELADSMGVRSAVCTHVRDGGRGATELAEAVVEVAEEPSQFHFLYPSEFSLKDKIGTVATTIYGADDVDYSATAERGLTACERNGFGDLPVCIAKTQYSISSDPSLQGAPTGWRLPVREVRASVGAGFVYPVSGEMSTMPGLGSSPAALDIDLDDEGRIVGLF